MTVSSPCLDTRYSNELARLREKLGDERLRNHLRRIASHCSETSDAVVVRWLASHEFPALASREGLTYLISQMLLPSAA